MTNKNPIEVLKWSLGSRAIGGAKVKMIFVLKYPFHMCATDDTNVQLMVPMSSGKCCSAIWISVVRGMI